MRYLLIKLLFVCSVLGINFEAIPAIDPNTANSISRSAAHSTSRAVSRSTNDHINDNDVNITGGEIYNSNVNGMLNVCAFGAKGDGVTDDTDAIAAALDAGNVISFEPGGIYLCSIDILDANTYLYLNGCTLKGKANATYIISLNAARNYLHVQDGFLDMSLMPNTSTTYGIRLAKGWGNVIRNIKTLGEPVNAFGLKIETGTYTTSICDSEFLGISMVGESIGNAVTTINLSNVAFEHGYFRYVVGATFTQPVIQGTYTKMDIEACYNIVLFGGDIEGSGEYLHLGSNVYGLYSLYNNCVALSGAYRTGTSDQMTLWDTHSATSSNYRLFNIYDNLYNVVSREGYPAFESLNNGSNMTMHLRSGAMTGRGSSSALILQNGNAGTGYRPSMWTDSNSGILNFGQYGSTANFSVNTVTGNANFSGSLGLRTSDYIADKNDINGTRAHPTAMALKVYDQDGKLMGYVPVYLNKW
jgi:hypothetical protein